MKYFVRTIHTLPTELENGKGKDLNVYCHKHFQHYVIEGNHIDEVTEQIKCEIARLDVKYPRMQKMEVSCRPYLYSGDMQVRVVWIGKYGNKNQCLSLMLTKVEGEI